MSSASAAADVAVRSPHVLHGGDRVWAETNCYVDLWIELLHSLGLEPLAVMAFAVAMDFEGDQWTFFKPPLADIQRLFGIDTQELAIWRPLDVHLIEQIERGRVPLVEVDSYFLPDTGDVSYRLEHVKTTIAVTTIDAEQRTLGYFHNAGLFELGADDYDGLFSAAAASLPPYTEIVKTDRVICRSAHELRTIARNMLSSHVALMPETNPFTCYRERYTRDTEWLRSQDMTGFHRYAFATLRQCGAAAELASAFLEWLSIEHAEARPASAHFASIATAAKAMQFKIARMIATGRPAAVADLLDSMESGWEAASWELRGRHAN